MEKDVPRLNDPMSKEKKKKDDKTLTTDIQMNYPLLKPIAFTNPIEDDFIHGGVWHLKK